MRFFTSSLFVAFFLINLCAQRDTFKGHEVVPYPTAPNLDSIIFKVGIDTIIRERQKSFDFFKTMSTLSEPSTISFLPLDKTWNLTKTYQKKLFLLNADIQIPVSLGGKKWGRKWLNTVHIIPQFKVRILQNDALQGDESLPVRTPSYLPRITYYGTPQRLWQRTTQNNNTLSTFFGLSAFHHSNGQDGNEFTDQGQINFYNGNFGENLVFEFTIGGVYDWYTKQPASRKAYSNRVKFGMERTVRTRKRSKPDRRLQARCSFEWHPSKWTNQAFLPLDLYGKTRINLQCGLSLLPSFHDLVFNGKKFIAITPAQQKESHRFVFNLSYILDKGYSKGDLNSQIPLSFTQVKHRLNFNITAYWRIRGTAFASLFVQAGYYGSDAYNIYFQQQLWQIRGGLAMAFFEYPRKGDYE